MTEQDDTKPEPEPARLHRPWRALVAVAELVLAVVAVWLAFQFWPNGIKDVIMTLSDGTVLTSTHYSGNWMSGAIALGTLGTILVVDAIRQNLLAIRTRHRITQQGKG